MSLWRADPQFEYWPDIMDEPSLLYDADWPTMPESLMNVFGVPSLLARRRRISRSERRRYSRSEVLSDKDKFQVTLDLPDFNIKEISVKLVENTLVVDAEHEERPEEVGHMYRRFRRRYILPRNAVAEELAATFSEDGVLVVAVPKKPKEMKQIIDFNIKQANERNIEIQQVRPMEVAMTVPEIRSSGTPITVIHETK